MAHGVRAPRLQASCAPGLCRRGPRAAAPSLRPAASLGFHDAGDAPAAAAPTAAPRASPSYGLTPGQMDALGLTGGARPSWAPRDEATVSARSSYGREVASMSSQPTRAVTSMRASGGGGGAPAQAPPDLPSLLLNARICYLGMPLVPSVTELLIAELLWLNFDNPEKPVYFYVNSTGSQSPDGKAVASETEAYAVLDTLHYIRPDVHTVCVGKAHGNAAMLLASGKKGCRYALPNASIALQAPRLNRKVDVATNLMISAKELDSNTGTYLDFVAEYCGRDRAEVAADVARTRYFTPQAAIEYGLIDRVVNPQTGGLGAALEKRDYEGELKRSQAGAGRGPQAYAGRD